MMTHDGFSKRRCRLEGNNIVIDAEFYPISSMRESPTHKRGVLIFSLVLSMLTIYLAFKCPILIVMIVPVWWGLLRLYLKAYLRGRTFWWINEKLVFTEQTDPMGIEEQIRKIALLYSRRAKETATHMPVGKEEKIKDFVELVWLIYFCSVLALGFSHLVDADFCANLWFPAIILFPFIRAWSFKLDYDRLKWKKWRTS